MKLLTMNLTGVENKGICSRLILILFAIIFLSFNSCEELGCWYCAKTNDAGYLEDKFVCSEVEMREAVSEGFACDQK